MSKMKISTEIGSASRIVGEEKAIELFAQNGFDAWDFTMFGSHIYTRKGHNIEICEHPFMKNDYLSFARRLKKVGEDFGIECNQSHAPQPTWCDEVRSYLKRAIECTKEAGGKICVIHPDNFKTAEENAEMYLELLPFAKECGIKIATENMYGWDNENNHAAIQSCSDPESFIKHLEAVNDEDFVACLDLGHAELKGLNTSATEMIRALSHKLKALHIHDNDKYLDLHMPPFSCDIDYTEIIKALKEIGYSGYLTMEAYKFLENYNEENILSGIKILADSMKKFRDLYENS